MPGLQPIIPTFARRGDFVPAVGGFLNVMLPAEEVRTIVMELYGRDAALVEIKSVVLGKSGHPYKTGDKIAVRRSQNGLSEIWEPISDREVREQEERDKAARYVQEEEARQAREEAERVAALEAAPVPEPMATEVTRVIQAQAERPAAARPRKKAGRR